MEDHHRDRNWFIEIMGSPLESDHRAEFITTYESWIIRDFQLTHLIGKP